MYARAPVHLQSAQPEGDQIRTVAELADFACDNNPGHLFCYQAEKKFSNDPTLRPVTLRQLKQAILRCEESLRELRDVAATHDGSERPRPVALFMDSDLSLAVYLLSLIALGIPALLLSARLSPDAIHSLLHDTKAAAIITSRRLQPSAQQALAKFNPVKRPSMHRPIPYQVLLDAPSGYCKKSICDERHYTHELDRNVIILHTSGSTGKPKTIYNSHRYLLQYATAHEFRDDAEAQALNLCTLPLYHAYGIMPIFMSLQVGETFCIPVCPEPPNGSSMLRLIRQAGARSFMTVPSILEEIYEMKDEVVWETLSRLNFVMSAGGPLKPSLGDLLVSKGVPLITSYGASEVGCIGVTYVPGPHDVWNFVHVRRDMDITFTPIDAPVGQPRRYRVTAQAFGWEEPFEPSDALEARDGSCREIRPVGRLDDVIVLGNGEKVSPYALETAISDLDDIKAAVVFGNGRFQLGVMVELAEKAVWDGVDAQVWEVIAATNRQMDGHARITSPKAVLKVPRHRAFPRTDKGNISRKNCYDAFAPEIDAVYRVLESTAAEAAPALAPDDLESLIRHYIEHELTWTPPRGELGLHDDLFELGMDSLQAVSLRRLLASTPKDFPRHAVSTHFVYENPTIAKMCQRLRRSHKRRPSKQFTRQTRIDDLVSKYADPAALDSPPLATTPEEPQHAVLLVGSTGGVGSHLLYELLRDPAVASITCLNRPHHTSLLAAQHDAFLDQGLPIADLPWHKCEHVALDADAPTLGLSRTQYVGLAHTLTHIVHNAWPVDFLRQLPSFERHIATTHRLLRLALDVHRHTGAAARFQFISTVGTVARYAAAHRSRVVPEVPMASCASTLESGYGEAKLACEKIVEAAQRDHPRALDAAVVRLGQVSGARRSGAWKPAEFIPRLLRSSFHLGYLPRLKGTFAWVPADDAARVVAELLFASAAPKAHPPSSQTSTPRSGFFGAAPPSPPLPDEHQLIYHVENPLRQPWADALPAFAAALGIPESRIVPYAEWLARLAAAAKNEPLDEPALLDFFAHHFEDVACGGVVLDTAEARKRSATLRSMDELGDDVLARYVECWRERGVLGPSKSPGMRALEMRVAGLQADALSSK